MSSRERLLTALRNEKPDRLPCQVHGWMDYYLKTYLKGMDQYDAYQHFKMDMVIYIDPLYQYNEKDRANWIEKVETSPPDKDGNTLYQRIIETPKGELKESGAYNQYTSWITEHIIKNENDFNIWNQYIPLPSGIDWSPVIDAKNKIGDRGIVRGSFYDFGQGGPWQSFSSHLYGVEKCIMDAFDKPEWLHNVFDKLISKKIKTIELAGKIPWDVVETGGGAGSSTVISPDMHKEFCLPYDKRQHEALHAAGTSIVYHLCGGIMPLLEIVSENGADGLETMTPHDMGGDCNLSEASSRIGNKMFFIGGLDQNKYFEKGESSTVRESVFDLFNSCPDGGYICSPSDHFFFGDPKNIIAFVEAVKECIY